MGCGSSQAAPQSNGDVKSDQNQTSAANNNINAIPKQKEVKPRSSSVHSKRSRKSSGSSSSSSSSSRSSGSKRSVKDVEKDTDEVDGEKTVEKSSVVATTTTTTTSPGEDQKQSENPQKEPEKEPEKEDSQKETKPEENREEHKVQEEPEKPTFDQEILKRFIDLDVEIKELASQDREALRSVEYHRLVELHKILTEQNEKVEELRKKTAKEYQDVVHHQHPSVKALFINEDQHESALAKEMQEYIEALNVEEVAEQELESTKLKYKNMYNAYHSLAEKCREEEKKLQDLQLEQETILGKVFNDSYGSDKEWKLEMELDLLQEKKERIHGAHFKWSNAQKFMRTAAGQVNWAARRWAQIASHNVQVPLAKYQMSAETRNHLIAASQNVKATHKFLEPIKVPYLTTEDLQLLDTSINTIFQDVQVHQRYQQSYACYVNYYHKCQNLLNWIDQVLNNTINKDLTEVKKEYHEKYYELKKERMVLIQAKIKEKLGIEISLEINKEEYKEEATGDAQEGETVAQPGTVNKEEGDNQAPEAEAGNDEPPAKLLQSLPSAAEGEGGESSETPAGEGEDKPAVKAVPLSELAPAPNQEDLFGDIEQLKKKHEEEIAEFEKAQEMNKARVEQGLQERLQARRSRRRKMKKQNDEVAQLGGESGDSLPPPPE